MSEQNGHTGHDDLDDFLRGYKPEFSSYEKREFSRLTQKMRKRNILRRIGKFAMSAILLLSLVFFLLNYFDLSKTGEPLKSIKSVPEQPPIANSPHGIPEIDTIVFDEHDLLQVKFKTNSADSFLVSLRFPNAVTGRYISQWSGQILSDTNHSFVVTIPFQLDIGNYVVSLVAGGDSRSLAVHKYTGPLFRVSYQIYPWLDNHEENIRTESKLFHVPDEYRVADWAKDIKPRFKTPASVDSLLRSITVNTNGLIDNWYNRTDSGWREKADNNTLFVNSNGSKVFKGKGKFAGRAFVITRWEHKPEGYDVLDSLKSGPERFVALGCWSDPHMRSYHILMIRRTSKDANR